MDVLPKESSCLLLNKEINCSTPPYTTIGDYVEASRIPVLKQNLLDMLEKFDPSDISYITEDNFEAFLPDFQLTSIKDRKERTFIINHEALWAARLPDNEKQDKFAIKLHRVPQKAVTMQAQENNMYLSSKPDESGYVQMLSTGEKIPDFNDPDTKQFFFFMNRNGENLYSFESSTNPDHFISTSPKENDHVTLQPRSKQDTYNMDFKVDKPIAIPTRINLSFTQKANITEAWNELINQEAE